jgi:3-hydroxyacyl-[acyl-carrier-protein] dehydratase
VIRPGSAVARAFGQACRGPLLPAGRRRGRGALDRAAVERLLPHREPFLLVDRITRVDHAAGLIVCRYDLARAGAVLEGHFPGRPVWPGVLQVEAVGQAGLCLVRLGGGPAGEAGRPVVLTHVLAARFLRPVTPGGDLEIVARVLPDGLFTVLVGQCLQHGAVCSAAALGGIPGEGDR